MYFYLYNGISIFLNMSYIPRKKLENAPTRNSDRSYSERRLYEQQFGQKNKALFKGRSTLCRSEVDCAVGLSLLKKGVKRVSLDVYNKFFR